MTVQIECTRPWEPPEPPSGAGGVLGLVEIAAEESRLDLDAVVRAFRADRLGEEGVPLEPDATATMVWERADGSYVSLDTLMTHGEAED
ncbi:MAG: hypothetical protein H0T70_00870 [Acidimicrobiia bacterium]|nr:hypothetical protein [Acidimicrobiia bacterium]